MSSFGCNEKGDFLLTYLLIHVYEKRFKCNKCRIDDTLQPGDYTVV
jgi:hypothetical protein